MIEEKIDALARSYLPGHAKNSDEGRVELIQELLDAIDQARADKDTNAIAKTREYQSALIAGLPHEMQEEIRAQLRLAFGDIAEFIDELVSSYAGGTRQNTAGARIFICKMLGHAVERTQKFEGRDAALEALQYEPAAMQAYSEEIQQEIRGMIASVLEDPSSIEENTAHTKSQESEFYYNRAIQAALAGDTAAALADLTMAIQINPHDAMAYKNRGVVRAEFSQSDDDYRHAILDYSKAIELDTQYADAYEARGYARYNLNDKEGARQDFIQAVRADSAFEFGDPIKEIIRAEGW